MTSPKLRTIHLFLLSILSGILLSIAWPERGFPGLLFIGLVPMLFIEDHVSKNPGCFIKFSVLLISYPGFLVWNILTTWWIVNSTLMGAVLANLLNALFMSIVFQVFHWSKKQLRFRFISYVSFICFWIALEYLHLNWDLNWPWLNLGNGFSSYYHWVQWYEYTGTFGGTLWVLAGNILMLELINRMIRKKTEGNALILHSRYLDSGSVVIGVLFLVWTFSPIGLSYMIYARYKETKQPVSFVIVQPNLNPYTEQYIIPPPEIIGRIMKLAGPHISDKTNFLVAPESAIQEYMWEDNLNRYVSIYMLKQIGKDYPGLNLLIGGSTRYAFQPGEKIPRTARKFSDVNQYYNEYNSAILMNAFDSLQLYHKSKLTPGVEILPSFKGFKWLEKYAIDLGGTVGSLGMDSVRKVYKTVNTVPVSPVICYESIFGEFFATFVKNGARIMVIITNDGWWGNTAGHRQHFSFAHLRAIETRRSIARSANTGISAFIDQRGDAHQVTRYWEPAVIAGNLNANSRLTFYVVHGDSIAWFFSWLGGVLFLGSLVISLWKRFKKLISVSSL